MSPALAKKKQGADRPARGRLEKEIRKWPPDPLPRLKWRQETLQKLRDDPEMLACAKAFYSQPKNAAEFIDHWCDTFDPRNAGKGPTRLPFLLFDRQRELVQFIIECYEADANGLIEKSKDMGATWLCVCISVWLFCFVRGATIGWGSRKAILVDRIGDLSSIFEKIRWELLSIPREFWPEGFDVDRMAYMRCWVDDGSRAIIGESGDDIGRGARTRIYFKDESAHYERPEAIESALSDTTRVQIDFSSVSGVGTVFHRKRKSAVEWRPGRKVQRGVTNLFVLDWSTHPAKNEEWHRLREKEASGAGLLHVLRREVDRSYEAGAQNVIIHPEWVRASIDAHKKIKGMVFDEFGAGLDVGDEEDGDKSALAVREGVVLDSLVQWGDRDVGVTARNAIDGLRSYSPIVCEYDCVGVGAGVKSEINRLKEDDLLPKGIVFSAWNAGAGPVNPDDPVNPEDEESPINKDFYANLKAQGWWLLGMRFYKTFLVITQGARYPAEELISLPSDLPELLNLQDELSQATRGQSTRLKMLVNKKPNGVTSPNMADAVVMCYLPVPPESTYDATLSWVR